MSLKSSGKLYLIKNDKVRYRLTKYYEKKYGLYSEISENQKIFSNGVLTEYFQNQFSRDTTYLLQPDEVKANLNDEHFQKIIKEQILFINVILENIEIQDIDDLIDMINKEIK